MRESFLIAAMCLTFCLLSHATVFAQALAVDVYTDKTTYELFRDTLVLSVSGRNFGPHVNVDVHIAIVTPEGAILEFPDWNGAFTPFMANVFLPSGFSMSKTELASLSLSDPSFPATGTGEYWFAAAFTEPGTLNFLSEISVAVFNIEERGDINWSEGKVGISYWDKYLDSSGVEVVAMGVFTGYAREPNPYIDVDEIEMNSCVLASWDSSEPSPDQAWYLDAGEPIDMLGSPLGDVHLTRTYWGDALRYGTDSDLLEGHYSEGTTYTFVGYGGADVRTFNVSVTAPHKMEVLQPAIASQPIVFRDSDLNLQWVSYGEGEIQVALDLDIVDMQAHSLTMYRCYCRFEDDGEGTIPSSILSQMPEGTTLVPPILTVSRLVFEDFEAEGLTEGGQAYGEACATGYVTLQ